MQIQTNIGLSTETVTSLMSILSERDGIVYTNFTFLRFSRPAVCLSSENGEQKTVTVETAKIIIKESCNGNGN